MTARKRCLSDTTGLIHLSTLRDCGSTHKICTGLSQTGSPALRLGSEKWHLTPNNKSYLQLILLAKGNSVFSNGISLDIDMRQASSPRIVDQPKINSMVFWSILYFVFLCYHIFLFYFFGLLLVCFDFSGVCFFSCFAFVSCFILFYSR